MSLLLLLGDPENARVTQVALEVAHGAAPPRLGPLLPAPCWHGRTRRLLAYFGAPFWTDEAGGLGTLMAAVARELTGCSRVERLQGAPVRAAGNFRVVTQFGPLTDVSGVFAVDEAAPPNVIGSYPVLSFADRTIVVDGAGPPLTGQRLVADYSYLQEGLERRAQRALAELNVQTAEGTWLEALAAFFGVPRFAAAETDAQLAARVIDRVSQTRNTETAIIAAVRRLTGGSPYLLSWFNAGHGNGFVFTYTPGSPWMGGVPDNHLVWGQNARFINGNTAIGGNCVFEVWIPGGSPYTDAQVLAVVNSYKAAGTQAIIRHYS